VARSDLASILTDYRRGAFRPVAVPSAAALFFVRGRVPVARFAAPVPALLPAVVGVVLVTHGQG
jgi:hypothetical protein